MTAPSLAWVGAAAADASTGTHSPDYPVSGVTAGDAIYVVNFNKAGTGTGDPGDPTPAAGWTKVGSMFGGTGTAGASTGPVHVTVWRRDTDADGSENGTSTSIALDNPGSGTGRVGLAQVFGVRPAAGGTLSEGWAGGQDVTIGTAFSATMGTDPGIDADDLAVALVGVDAQAGTSFSSESISAAGCTFGTVTNVWDTGTSAGNDVRGTVWDAACTAGPSTAAAVIAATSAGNVSGVGALMRVRESTGGAVALDGKATAAASATGAPAVTRPLQATASAAASSTATALVARPLQAAAPAAAGAAGTLTASRPLAATAAAVASATGILDVAGAVVALDGIAPAAASATGTLTAGRPLDATASTASSTTGTLSSIRPLAAAAIAAASATGDLSIQGQIQLGGLAPAAASATGTLFTIRPLSAAAPAVANAVAVLARARPLDAVASGAADATGSLTVGMPRTLTGIASLAATAAGTLSVTSIPTPRWVEHAAGGTGLIEAVAGRGGAVLEAVSGGSGIIEGSGGV
jgi:hypothetical protein